MNLPNALTLFRIFLVPVLVAVLFSTHLPFRELIASAIVVGAALTDLLDGYFARRRRQITTLGTLLDPIADKLLMSAAFISLVQLDSRMVPAWMVVIILGREFAVSGLRSIAAAHNYIIAANELGKAKMVTQVVAVTTVLIGHRWPHIPLLGINWDVDLLGKIALWLVVVLALGSAYSYFRKFWQQLDEDFKLRERKQVASTRS